MNAVAPRAEFKTSASRVPVGRHRFTLEEVLALQATGVMDGEKTELIDGDIVHMPEDGELHRRWSGVLTRWFIEQLSADLYGVLVGTTLPLGTGWAPSPDFYIYPADLDEGAVDGANVLLVVEEADSSLRRDLRAKPADYARHGVRDYWVIDLNARRLHVHREPSPEGYRSVRPFEREEAVDALLIPGLSLRLADLPRVG